jgi:hypothetical protein
VQKTAALQSRAEKTIDQIIRAHELKGERGKKNTAVEIEFAKKRE